MKKLSILFTVILMLTACGREVTPAVTQATQATETLPKLDAQQVNELQQYAIDHPQEVGTPPVMPTSTEAGARGIFLHYTPTQVTNLYNWAQNLYANNDPRAGRVAGWFNHIVSVKCNLHPYGPVCGQYGGGN